MKRTKIGQLDERIEFKVRQVGADSIGGTLNTFSSLGSCWCKVVKNAKSNDNEEHSGKVTGEREVEFIIRYRTDLNESYFIKYEDELGVKYYKIESIEELSKDRRKAFLSIKGTKYDINK
jgi:SPP1 family predicted phage head-tail adaptor